MYKNTSIKNYMQIKIQITLFEDVIEQNLGVLFKFLWFNVLILPLL